MMVLFCLTESNVQHHNPETEAVKSSSRIFIQRSPTSHRVWSGHGELQQQHVFLRALNCLRACEGLHTNKAASRNHLLLSHLWKRSLSIITSPTDSFTAPRSFSMQSFRRGSDGWRPVFFSDCGQEIRPNLTCCLGQIYPGTVKSGWLDTEDAYWDEVWDGDLLLAVCDGVEKHVFHSRAGGLGGLIPGGVKSKSSSTIHLQNKMQVCLFLNC